MEKKIRQLETEQINMWREMKQVRADAQFWKERAFTAESCGWGPHGPGYFNPTTPMQSKQPPFPSQPPPGQFGASVGPRQAGCNPIAEPFFPSECGDVCGRPDGYMQNATADSTNRVDPNSNGSRSGGMSGAQSPNSGGQRHVSPENKTYLCVSLATGRENLNCLVDRGYFSIWYRTVTWLIYRFIRPVNSLWR